MDRLWAPWRVKYVTEIIDKAKGCVFCKMAKQKADRKNFIFIRTKHCFGVLNIYPYNNGHVLVLPYRHVGEMRHLSEEETKDFYGLINRTKDLLDKAIKPDGYNIGMNLGRISGAGFPDHIHMHIVPRWKGDVNFMPVIGETKIMSQSLQDVYRRLMAAQKETKPVKKRPKK